MQVSLVFTASPSAARMSYSLASACSCVLHVHVVFHAFLTAVTKPTGTLAITYCFSVIVTQALRAPGHCVLLAFVLLACSPLVSSPL